MSIYYHIGSSGAGKTKGVQERIIADAAADRDRSFLFIVPEQFTLQTQREILKKSSNGGMMNIDALSFARLAHRVFEEQGVSLPQILEDTGKSMIVKKILQEHQDELTIYRSKVKKQGFVEEMKSMIAEFYQYGISLDKLKDMEEMAGERRILRSKLHDIKIIYEAFAKFIEGRFIMNEEILDKMCEIAGESALIRDSVVVLDGFTGFTPSQYNCIDKLMKYAKDIHVVLSVSMGTVLNDTPGVCHSEPSPLTHRHAPRHSSAHLFELSLKTIDKLEKLAIENNIKSDFVFYKGEEGRFRNNPSLAHLEQNIFRFPYSRSKNHSSVTLLSAKDMDEETDFVVAKIRELIFEDADHINEQTGKRMKYEDIAVLTGDLSSYGHVLSGKLLKAGIPYFIDEKRSIVGMPAVEFVDAAMDIVLSNFSYESVFRFLKTGFCGIEPDGISRTENYVIEKGIKGYRRWKQKWKTSVITDLEPDIINMTREKILGLLDEMILSESKEQRPSVTERLTYLYNILDACEVELKLFNLSEGMKNSKNPKERAKGIEIGQLFKSIVSVFERINSLLSDERMPLKEFKEVLDTGFSEAKLRSIPGGVDSIVVGDMERTRIDNKRILFFVGCNDSVLPGSPSKVSLLNEFDRELFADNDIELSPTARENSALKEFYLYLALTKPSDKLYLSYSKRTGDSGEAGPAYIFGRIMKLYSGLEVKKLSEYEKDNIYRIIGSNRGLSSVIDYLKREYSKSLSGISERKTVSENENGEGICDKKTQTGMILKDIFETENSELMRLLTEAAAGRRKQAALSAEEAEQLYGRIIVGSITRLQQFAQCAFSHFAKYGLGLKERKEYKIGGPEIGDIYHKALCEYASGLKKEKIRWSECAGEERMKREQEAIDRALSGYEDIVTSSRRYEYIKRSLSRVFDKTVDIVSKQIQAGKFDVAFVEKAFAHESTLMKLKGVIDRVDVVKKNGKTYFRIIDYKTGRTAFDVEKMKAGLQLQLAIYTAEAAAELSESGDDPVPCGMYYYKIDDPILDVKPKASKTENGSDESGSEEAVQKEIMKKLRLDGLTVDQNEIIAMHDSAMISEQGDRIPGSSSVINYECKKDGRLSKASEKIVIEPAEFDKVSRTASDKAKELAGEILKGKVSVNPYQYKQENACQYCIYRSVCKFDRRLGDNFREI